MLPTGSCFMSTKSNEFATSATQISKVKSETLSETRFDFQYPDSSSAALPTTTIRTIRPIDEDQDHGESPFNRNWYNIYDFHLHITHETVKEEHVEKFTEEAIDKSANNTCNEDIREIVLHESKAEVTSGIGSSAILGSKSKQMDDSSEVCEVRRHMRKKRNESLTSLRNQLSSQNLSNSAGPSPTVSSDSAPATMTVCRVCLAMNVRMYHMSEHKLRVMYERVTGLEIKSEDMLPQKLCWECTARLSSANYFMEKALKAHWILMNITNRSRLVTMRDIQSVDKAVNQLESSLSPKFYDVNHANIHIVEENTQTIFDHKVTMDFSNNNEQINSEQLETNEEQLTIATERVGDHIITRKNITCNAQINYSNTIAYKETECSDVGNEIKSEIVDISSKDIVNSIKEENMSDEEGAVDTESNSEMSQEDNQIVNQMESTEVCEVIKQWRKGSNNSSTQLRNQSCTITTLPHRRELLSKYNTPDSSSSAKDNENGYHNSIKDGIKEDHILDTLTNSTDINKALKYEITSTDNPYVSDPCNISQTISMRNSNVNRNNLIPNDTESLKKLFICDICNKQFHWKSVLIRHIRKHLKVQFNKFISQHTKSSVLNCSYCSYIANRKSNLNQHINSKHTKSTVFNCSYCSHKAYQKVNLDKHINSKHTKSTVFNCSYCSYKAYEKGSLNYHIMSLHTKSTLFSCSYCSYKAHQKCNLDQHINSQHTKSTVFNCSCCSYKTHSKGNLDKHINSKHTKSTVFKCSYCSYKAYDKSSVTYHINSQHTKSTVFSCSYCSYKAHKKCHLNQHINSQHTKSTVFSCSYCSYKAYQKGNLDRHINSQHTKRTVFHCSNCNFETFYKPELSKHVKVKHDRN